MAKEFFKKTTMQKPNGTKYVWTFDDDKFIEKCKTLVILDQKDQILLKKRLQQAYFKGKLKTVYHFCGRFFCELRNYGSS